MTRSVSEVVLHYSCRSTPEYFVRFAQRRAVAAIDREDELFAEPPTLKRVDEETAMNRDRSFIAWGCCRCHLAGNWVSTSAPATLLCVASGSAVMAICLYRGQNIVAAAPIGQALSKSWLARAMFFTDSLQWEGPLPDDHAMIYYRQR